MQLPLVSCPASFLASCLVFAGAGSAFAQVTTLQEYAVPQDRGPQQVVVQVRDFAPGEVAPWHIHHGVEIARLESGEMELITAQGTVRLVAGESFQMPAGQPHSGRNPGTGVARLVITLVVDRDAPLRELVADPH